MTITKIDVYRDGGSLDIYTESGNYHKSITDNGHQRNNPVYFYGILSNLGEEITDTSLVSDLELAIPKFKR